MVSSLCSDVFFREVKLCHRLLMTSSWYCCSGSVEDKRQADYDVMNICIDYGMIYI